MRRELSAPDQGGEPYQSRPPETGEGAVRPTGDVVRRVEETARLVLAANRRRGVSAWEQESAHPAQPLRSSREYDFVCPSATSYPFQWFWDSCFHAIALIHVDVALAEQELRCLLQGARADGFMPHMILWDREAHEQVLATYNVSLSGRYATATIQPPLLAQALERVYLSGGNRAFLDQALPVVSAYHDWLAASRDPDGGGLIAILQPDESGLDASPKYDRAMRLEKLTDPALRRAMRRLFDAYQGLWSHPAALLARQVFTWTDCLVNACYLQAQAAEARLLDITGQLDRAASVRARHARGLASLLARCWDESAGAFFDYHAPEPETRAAGEGQKVGYSSLRSFYPDWQREKVLTISSLMPLILDDLPREIVARLIEQHLTNPAEFWLPYGLPSVAASEPSFEPDFRSGLVWRGPTWVNTNWLLIKALEAHGYMEVAEDLAARTVEMVDLGGMRECFNPYTAEGYGAHDFAWSTLVLDLFTG